MMINTEEWKNHDRIDFKNQDLPIITFPEFRFDNGSSLKTEIHFVGCRIDGIHASCLYLEKKVELTNCVIYNMLGFLATYFYGGFEMRNCILKDRATFESGVHNSFPSNFIIENCIFEEYVDFFDIYFEGTTIIRNNKFLNGTNLGLYAIKVDERAKLILENNQGDLTLAEDDDPFYGKEKK